MDNTYKNAGVDIHLANRIINQVKPIIRQTHIPGVMSDIGHFAGLFSLAQEKINDPVLVSGTDGVGTKLIIANLMDKHDTIGIDLVAMCVNDILTTGAKPLFFLDYLASGKLEEKKMTDIIKGVTDGCKQAGCALLGGETAEMPGFYKKGDYDLAGFAVGIVDRGQLITGTTIKSGDILLGLASSGVHSNGFSLIRKIFSQEKGLGLNEKIVPLKCTLGEEFLRPTKIYVPAILSLLKKYEIKGIAHITGGGFYDNIPRILPPGLAVNIHSDSWPLLSIFELVQAKGKVTDKEMFQTFNMGIGLVLIAKQAQYQSILSELSQAGEAVYPIGEVIQQKDPDRIICIDK